MKIIRVIIPTDQESFFFFFLELQLHRVIIAANCLLLVYPFPETMLASFRYYNVKYPHRLFWNLSRIAGNLLPRL